MKLSAGRFDLPGDGERVNVDRDGVVEQSQPGKPLNDSGVRGARPAGQDDDRVIMAVEEEAVIALAVAAASRSLLAHVPGPAHAVQKLALEPFVNLPPQSAHVHVHDIRAGTEIVVPDLLDDRHPSANPSRGPHQPFQQPLLARGEFDGACSPPRHPGHGVERQIAHAQDCRFRLVAPADQRAHTGDQFLQRERLGKVIIGAGIESNA